MRELVITGSHVADLRALEEMRHLEILWMSNNQVTSLAPLDGHCEPRS